MTTLEEARKLREQLRPAFAGYLTDGNISDRDVLATLLDLVVREKVLLDMELKDEGYTVNKIVRVAGPEGSLLPFERLFLKELFRKSNEITPYEFGEIIRSRKLHKMIGDNLGALKDIEIIETELKFIKNDKPIYFYINNRRVNSIEKAKRFSGGLKIISFFMLILLVGGTYTIVTSPDFNFYDLIPLYFICAAIMVVSAFIYHSFEKSKKVLELKMKVIPAAKKKYEELFEFIQRFPLTQQRLDNEFMPFAVAFGLDSSWNKSFGIQEEIVVVSEARAE